MKNRVKELRERLNLSQEEFSKLTNISRPHISEIENGKVKEIGSSVMFKISKVLGEPIENIFFTEDVVFTHQKGE